MAQDSKTENLSDKVLADDDKRFTVTDRKEMVRTFRGLAKDMINISAIYHGGHDMLLTAVIDVDPEKGVVYLDTNASELNNQRLRASKRTHFVTMIDGAKIQWATDSIQMDEYDGRPAFRIAIPETMQRIQRRGVFRIKTPIANPLVCKIPLPENKQATVTLADICAEGIGVVLPDEGIPEIVRGAQFENCTIDFPEIGVIAMTMTVQSTWEITLRNGSISHRAGLAFTDMRSGIQSRVQRYINNLQRARITSRG